MYSDSFPPAAFGVETNAKSGGFIPSGGFGNFGNESEFGGMNSVPSIYNPYLASSSDTHTRKCIPLNVTMIHRAYNENPGARIVMNGEEVGHFKLVGRVRNFKSIKDGGAEKFSFDLVDDTGSIQVDWLVSYTAEGNTPWLQQYYDNFERRATEHPAVSFYAKVFGECNLRGIHEPRVKANAVHIVTAPLEIESHKQDVIIAHLTQPGSAMAQKFLQLKHDSGILAEARASISSAGSAPIWTPPVVQPAPTSNQPAPTSNQPGGFAQSGGFAPCGGFQPSPNNVGPSPARQTRLSVLQPPATPARSGGSRPSVPAAQPTPSRPSSVASTTVRDNVYKFLLEMQESHPNGVHVKIIAHNAGTDIAGAREALKSLEETGDAYFKKSEDWWTAI